MTDIISKPALVILAAGVGSRYNGPKQLDGFGPFNETLIDYTLYDAQRIGFSKVVIIIRKDLENQFRTLYESKVSSKMTFEFVFQELDSLPSGLVPPKDRTKPWGTGHAIMLCKEIINEPFVIVNADDLYGRSALQQVFDHMKMTKPTETRVCIGGYLLKNTLSMNGGVSRGICDTTSDFDLISIAEAIEIKKETDGMISGKIANKEGPQSFSGEEIVSMNLIGMTSDLFPLLESAFTTFFQENHKNLEAEFYLPNFINSLLNKVRVKVLKTEATWFGVTYQADKSSLQINLEKFSKKGVYPPRLWE